jgi:hypothetical protein
MFEDKARSVPKSGAPGRYLTWVGSSLTHNYYVRLERLARDKNFSLLWTLIDYGRIKFYDIRPVANVIKLFTAAHYEFL